MGNVVKFFLLTYALAWAFFITGVIVGKPIVFLPGVFAPAIVALALTWRSEGGTGVRALLKRVMQWRVRWQWYAFAIGFMAVIKLTAAVIHRLALGVWPHFGTTPVVLMLAAIVISTPVQAGEEIGWRGYALPQLAKRIGFGGASIVVGVFWALWHIPQFFIPGADTRGQSLPLFVIQVTAYSVVLAWLYVRTNGSLLLTMLMHAAGNNTKDIVPSAVPGAANPFALSTSVVAWIAVTLLWICAAYFLARMSRGRRGHPFPPPPPDFAIPSRP